MNFRLLNHPVQEEQYKKESIKIAKSLEKNELFMDCYFCAKRAIRKESQVYHCVSIDTVCHERME